MSSFQPISVPRLYRMIAGQIRARIEAGDYAVGQRLPSERELAEQLDVSRPSVREALIALELEGLVDVRVGAGVFVTCPAAASLAGASLATAEVGAHELLEVRLLVEPMCAELAARHASAAQLDAIAAAMHALPGAGSPSQHNDRLHLLIAEASGNAALAATVAHLWTLGTNSAIFNQLNQHLVLSEVWDLAQAEHQVLMAALRARKPLAARRAMQAHLVGIRSRLGLDCDSDASL